MSKITFDVQKNKKETKYITPEGREVARVSSYKKILGDPWSKYNIGLYKGRDNAFAYLAENREFLENEDHFKKFFNLKAREKKENALDKGHLYHEEMEVALKEENYRGACEYLVEMEIDGELVTNPFAKMLLTFFAEHPEYHLWGSEKSFTYEDERYAFGGTMDCILINPEKDHAYLIDFKTSSKTKEERNQYLETKIEYIVQLAVYRSILQDQIKNVDVLLFWEDELIESFESDILNKGLSLFFQSYDYQKSLKEMEDLLKKA